MIRDLALRVIETATQDMELIGTGKALRIGRHTYRRAVQDAVDFLTSMDEDWAEQREFWCGHAGVNAHEVRRWALRRLGELKEAGVVHDHPRLHAPAREATEADVPVDPAPADAPDADR